MTITDAEPYRTDQAVLTAALGALGEAITLDGIVAHERAVQRLAAAARMVAPGAAHSLADAAAPGPIRERAFDVVVRVTLRCADAQTQEMLSFALAEYVRAHEAVHVPT